MTKIKRETSRLAFNMIWKFFERAGVQIINLLFQIFLARLISPEKFGDLAIIIVFYNFIDLFIQVGFSSSLIRKKELTDADRDTVFLVSCLFSLLGYGILFFIAPWIGNFYNNFNIITPLRVVGVTLFFSPLFCVGNAILIRGMKFKAIFVRGILSSIISGIFGLYLALKGYEIWALVAQIILNQFVLTGVMCLYTRYYGGFLFSRKSLIEILSFGKNVLATELMLYGVESIRSLMVGKYYNEKTLAFYDRGQLYPSTLMRAINDTLFSTLLPFFSKKQNDDCGLADSFQKVLYISTIIIFPVFTLMLVSSKEIIIFLLSDVWLESVVFMQIFCIYQIFFPYQIVSKAVLYAKGASNGIFKLEMVRSIFSLLLLVYTIKFGVLYVACSLIVVRIFSGILYVSLLKISLKKYFKLNMLMHTVKPFIASLVMAIIIYFINLSSECILLTLVIKSILGITSYVVLLLIMDFRGIVNLIKST